MIYVLFRAGKERHILLHAEFELDNESHKATADTILGVRFV